MAANNQDIFRPITEQTRDIAAILKCRAEYPDLWRDHWPDDSRVLAAHDRFSRILTFYCGWPNAFFVPFDPIYVMIDAGKFESLDLVEFIMTLEEVFDIKISDDDAQKIPFSYYGETTYGQFLEALISVCEPEYKLIGVGYKWEPLRLPADYFEKSLWQDFKRYLPFTWTDRSLDRELRRLQAARPSTWPDQWADYDDRSIQIRDKVSRILVDELGWFDCAFIPQDRLEALFHSHRSLDYIPQVLERINREFNSAIEPDFITFRQHIYSDLIKILAEKF